MALTNTTLASAMAASDTVAVLAASTGVAARCKLVIDNEEMLVSSAYTTAGNGVNVPVIRGQAGTYAYAHPTGAKVNLGAASDSEWGSTPPGSLVDYPPAGRAFEVRSYTAAGAIELPEAGGEMYAILNGTTILAMTVADPKTSINGSKLWIASNGVAAHTITFASGLSGTGASGSYDVITVNASGTVLLGPFIALAGAWQLAVAVPLAGTVTNITATVA